MRVPPCREGGRLPDITADALTGSWRMQPNRIKVLLIEESPKFARLMQEMLQQARGVEFEIQCADSLAEGLARLEKSGIDVLLLGLSLSESNRLKNFEDARDVAAHVPMIVLSSVDDETLALQSVQVGAQDYLVKTEIDASLLVRSIRYAIERKRAEAAVLQAEEKYRSIFEHSVEGIFQTTPDGHYLSANPALARIYGYDSAAELMAHLTDIADQLYVEPARRQEFVRLMEDYDVVTDFESRVQRRDGRIIWIAENVRAVRDEKHELLYYEGTVEDITERKRGEQQVRDSEALYHSLVENLPQNILRKDLNERFTFANQRFCQTLGKPLEEIIGKTDFDFFPPELAAKYQQDDRRVIEEGKPFETIEEHIPPGGGKLYVEVSKTPLYDSSGKIIGLQGIFSDITERRRAEEGLRRTTVELARSREELRSKNEQMEEDLRMAREIQQAIIPQLYPTFPKSAEPQDTLLRFCHRYFPTGAVGGDFFYVRALSDTQAGVFICDVMGHGVRSALVTAIMRALVEELAELATDPGRLLGQINNDLRAILRQRRQPDVHHCFLPGRRPGAKADLFRQRRASQTAADSPSLQPRGRPFECDRQMLSGFGFVPGLRIPDFAVFHCPRRPADAFYRRIIRRRGSKPGTDQSRLALGRSSQTHPSLRDRVVRSAARRDSARLRGSRLCR